MLYFHPSIEKLVKAAKVLAGVPEKYGVRMSFSQLVEFLTNKGVKCTLRSTSVEKKRWHPAQQGWFSSKPGWIENISVSAQGIEIGGTGTVPPFDEVNIYYSDQIEEGRLKVALEGGCSLGFFRAADESVGWQSVEVAEPVREFLAGLMPVYRLELEQPVVELPMPPWTLSVCDMSSGEGGAFSYVLFRSQAEQMVAEFAAQLGLHTLEALREDLAQVGPLDWAAIGDSSLLLQVLEKHGVIFFKKSGQ